MTTYPNPLTSHFHSIEGSNAMARSKEEIRWLRYKSNAILFRRSIQQCIISYLTSPDLLLRLKGPDSSASFHSMLTTALQEVQDGHITVIKYVPWMPQSLELSCLRGCILWCIRNMAMDKVNQKWKYLVFIHRPILAHAFFFIN